MPSLAYRAVHRLQKFSYFARTGYRHTGERVHPLFPSENFKNHLKVYQYLSQFTAGKRVLDVGCGTGYGTAEIAKNAAMVCGIDVSLEAIEEAKRLYPEILYLEMDAENLDAPNRSFDVVISTENFEHLHNQGRNIREIGRVLSPDGFAFIATPNPELTEGNNSFHTKENTYSELKELLSRQFSEVEIIEPTEMPTKALGQRDRDRRFNAGEHGKIVTSDLQIFGQLVDQTYLSNTHSFHCFVRN